MPATDIARSTEFYKAVFGWTIRKRGDGSTAFDDTTGEVSGTWCTRPGLSCILMLTAMIRTVSAR